MKKKQLKKIQKNIAENEDMIYQNRRNINGILEDGRTVAIVAIVALIIAFAALVKAL